ncbi:MAG: bifunctional glutamate--cysteine ligase GshA/glutathione synthetase GshB [Simkaniaceae bacterium]|nr:bifunctional glutamate--cysteine ligase GshA/glutathione synthetase GshB [Simkaniaceae bacterium]
MIGLERETLRITEKGDLAKTSHPPCFGSPLTHKSLTLDFAEAQLELVTPPFDTTEKALLYLQELQSWVEQKTFLWPLSMPCKLPLDENIPIATFGPSEAAKQKELYRHGLAFRYDFKMQLISGIHLNFSFPDYTTEKYFALMRNVLREGWIITYLFGASPAADLSYFSKTPELQKWDETTYFGEYATSLRMSCYGYYSKLQQQLAISYNCLDEYLRDLEGACKTTCPCYIRIGKNQISDAYLQIPAEHYTRIRPKSSSGNLNSGVTYVEWRGLDLDPFFPTGIDPKTVAFVETFLKYCEQKPSPKLTRDEMLSIAKNQNQVALYGRKKDLCLIKDGKQTPLTLWRDTILKDLKEPLPPLKSEQILSAMKGMSHKEFGLSIAKKYHTPKPSKVFDAMAIASLEPSTQLVIAEAIRRNLSLEILDSKQSIIRIGNEIIKQATITSLDSIEVLDLLQDKAATKKMLQDGNLSVPQEKSYTESDLVIKPNSANFGDGISFIKKGDRTAYEKALERAQLYDPQVIVEEKVHGDEYRFLVIGKKVVAVAKRLPAYVIGDGISTLLELTIKKREQQKKTRPEKECIRLSDVTCPTLIPKKGDRIFLRLNTNVSTGGEAIDVTDTIEAKFKEIALQAAKILGAAITGIDMIIDGKNYWILEANHNPHLALHANPTEGMPREPSKPLLDLLGFADPQGPIQ